MINITFVICYYIAPIMELDFTSYQKQYEFYEQEYLAVLNLALQLLDVKCSPIISVALVDDEAIQTINRTYRHIDRPTDVISFAFLDDEPNRNEILASDKEVVLGDIYISIDRALEQAKTYGHSEKREFLFLFVHGLLHLLGYDHTQKEDEAIMFELQEKILKSYEVNK